MSRVMRSNKWVTEVLVTKNDYIYWIWDMNFLYKLTYIDNFDVSIFL